MKRRVPIRRVLVLTLGAVVCLSSTDAWAQKKKNPDRAIAKWDKDGDGKVSPEEWKKPQKIFKKIDKDGDGFLTAEDFAKHWGLKAGGDSQDAASEKDRVKRAKAYGRSLGAHAAGQQGLYLTPV